MSNLNHLQNFPFKSMEELNMAVLNKQAEPVVPLNFARQWGTNRSIHVKRSYIFLIKILSITSFLAIIFFSFINENIRWYDTIISYLFSFLIIQTLYDHKFRNRIEIRIIGLVGLAALIFILNQKKIDYSILYFISACNIFFYSYMDKLALKGIIKDALTYNEILTELWDQDILWIKTSNGELYRKSKDNN